MRFLFVSTILGPTIGGTETLIARMSKWLLDRGHQVTLLTNSVGDFRDIFDGGLQVIEAGDRILDLCYLHGVKTTWSDLHVPPPDVIKAFNLTASWISTLMALKIKPTPKIIFGNYNPDTIPKSRHPFKHNAQRLYLRNLITNYPDGSILCMTKEQVAEFQKLCGNRKKVNFWPLPVEDPSRNAPARAPRQGNIVSIGRLDPLKGYNLYMIDVMAHLRSKNLPATWTVYGEGGLREEMDTRIHELGLNDAVRLEGNLPYRKLAEALREAYLFVGMGTSVIEAALCGVPTVVALGYDTTGVTYGPLQRFPFGNCGEPMATPPNTTVEAEIERILGLSEVGYRQEVQETKQYAKSYDMDKTMGRFLSYVEKAAPPKPHRALFYWFYVFSIVRRFGS
jgi:glycosyltransferase involved in cell wall biosynthesis